MTVSLRVFLANVVEISRRISAGCCGGSLEPLEQALLQLISKDGAFEWEKKAEVLRERFPQAQPQLLQEIWGRLESKIASDESMACGHKCSTCPTRHSCQAHVDSCDVKCVKDIEDL